MPKKRLHLFETNFMQSLYHQTRLFWKITIMLTNKYSRLGRRSVHGLISKALAEPRKRIKSFYWKWQRLDDAPKMHWYLLWTRVCFCWLRFGSQKPHLNWKAHSTQFSRWTQLTQDDPWRPSRIQWKNFHINASVEIDLHFTKSLQNSVIMFVEGIQVSRVFTLMLAIAFCCLHCSVRVKHWHWMAISL